MNRQKDKSVIEFENILIKHINDLDTATQNLQTAVQFHPCTIDLSAYQTPDDYANAIHHPEIIAALESMFFTFSCQDDFLILCD